MIKARKKRTISMVVTLVFLLSVLMPAAAFADTTYASFTGSYKYVEAKSEQAAGVATVTYKAIGGATEVYFKVTLPEGVTFNESVSSTTYTQIASGVGCDISYSSGGSNYIEVKSSSSSWDSGDSVKFDFGTNSKLDIASDFTGDIKVNVEVFGIDASSIVWAESADVLVAKVISGDVTVTAADPVMLKVGQNKSAAKITIQESIAGQLKKESVADTVYFEILTSGVTFNSSSSFTEETRVGVGALSFNDDNDLAWATVDTKSTVLPGKLKFAPVLDIAPNVTGDIEISVWSSGNEAIDETTVVVGKIGSVTVEVEKIKNNDGTVYNGQSKLLKASFYLSTTDGTTFADGKLITLTLNRGKFVAAPKFKGVTGTLYNSSKSAYWSTASIGDDTFKIDQFNIKAKNDYEVGDITVTIGGDFGDIGEVVIGELAKPYTVSAEKPAILSEALSQAAGDIIITEADAGAITEPIKIALPSGIELSKTPKVEVTEGNIDVSISKVEGDIVLTVDRQSTKKSVIRVYNIYYDTGRLALLGDVNLSFVGDVTDGTDDTVMTTVANATVGDKDIVTATFAVGNEGVAIQNGRVLVQVNTLCDILGLQKSWDAATKTAYFVKDGKVVAFPMNENAIYINGVKVPVDQGGIIINGATFATVRGIQMAFGGDLEWDGATKTATFTFNK